MRIYTRKGDSGETGLLGGGRTSKASVRVEAYGAVDELNAVVGVTLLHVRDERTADRLRTVQHDLFALGAVLSSPPPEGARRRPELPPVPVERTGEMETWMDEAGEELEPLRSFVLPGGSPGAAWLHLCRTVCRRAERAVVRLGGSESVEEGVVPYLNRLSDLFFVLARLENARGGVADARWEGGRES